MPNPTALSKRFLDLHRKGRPLLLANAWDTGSARRLALWRPVTSIVRDVLGPPTGAIGLLAFEVCAATLVVYALARFDLAMLRREYPR